MSEMDEFYQILELNPGASEAEINQAYRDLVKVWHPDRFPDKRLKEKANEKLKTIIMAHEKLVSYIAGETHQVTTSDREKSSESKPPPYEESAEAERERTTETEDEGYSGFRSPPKQPSGQPPSDDEVISERGSWITRSKGIALALIVIGVLILLDRMSAGYGLREGWPWLVIALGIGGILGNRGSLTGWVTTVIGIFILGTRYYTIHISIPVVIRTYFLPILLIVIGLLFLLKYLVRNGKG